MGAEGKLRMVLVRSRTMRSTPQLTIRAAAIAPVPTRRTSAKFRPGAAMNCLPTTVALRYCRPPTRRYRSEASLSLRQHRLKDNSERYLMGKQSPIRRSRAAWQPATSKISPAQAGTSPHSAFHLQRGIGNQAMQRLLSGTAVQRKRTAGRVAEPAAIPTRLVMRAPDDAYEREAHQVAAAV